mgnify:CR=1 FL=1
MRTVPPFPNPGEKITATLLREILRELRANTPLEGTGTRMQRTPNGTHIHAQPAGRAGKSSAPPPGCFDLSSAKADAETSTVECAFLRRYYRVGGRTWEKDPDLEEDETSGAEVPFGGIVGLEITWNVTDEPEVDETPTCVYGVWDGLSALQTAEKDVLKYVVPLYKFDDDGKLEADLRNAPAAAMGEFE